MGMIALSINMQSDTIWGRVPDPKASQSANRAFLRYLQHFKKPSGNPIFICKLTLECQVLSVSLMLVRSSDGLFILFLIVKLGNEFFFTY